MLIGIAAFATGAASFDRARAQATLSGLEPIATFTEARQVTGVAVGPEGRMFTNFPRWERDTPISLAEVGSDGGLTGYPMK